MSAKGVKPRLLDLFCGAGGAAMGYHRAGFEVVGVDINQQPNYPFEFKRYDALRLLDYWLHQRGRPAIERFDAIHASPPCQAYTTMANRLGRSHYAVIDETRELLERTGLPYVIENVSGAKRHMRSPRMSRNSGGVQIELTGEMFHLGVHRPRLFESNVMLLAAPRPDRQRDPIAVYGKPDQRRLWTRRDGSELRAASLEEAQEAMGMDWADWHGTKEAIPPAYTEHIGHQLLQHLNAGRMAEDMQPTKGTRTSAS